MQSLFYKIGFFCFIVFAWSLSSCKKFLESYSQNNSFVETVEDLDELLVGDAYFKFYNTPSSAALYTMDDDTKIGLPSNRSYMETGFHFWQAQPRLNSEGQLTNSDDFFNAMYGQIARINTILLNVNLLREKGESVSHLNRVAGEAYFLRAYYYFFLANLYGKPYKVETASTDFCVPLKTEPAIKSQFASRSTNQEVFNQILSDLQQAENYLQGSNESSSIRANQVAAQGLLCRVYLFMEKYDQSVLYANKVIANRRYKVTDLNGYLEDKDYLKKTSAEVLLSIGSYQLYEKTGMGIDVPNIHHYLPSDELIQLYQPNDLRLKAFFQQNTQGLWKFAKKRDRVTSSLDEVSDFYLIRLSEIYLNKAEALAAMGQSDEAKTAVQAVRSYRFEEGSLSPIMEEGAALVGFIRDERRRELCLEAHRWFDLRRYAVNSKYPFSKIIRHRSVEFVGNSYQENGYYELGLYETEPGAYIVPIANDEIEFNQGAIVNEPRSSRPLKH